MTDKARLEAAIEQMQDAYDNLTIARASGSLGTFGEVRLGSAVAKILCAQESVQKAIAGPQPCGAPRRWI